MDLRDKTVCIVDNGLFTSFAATVAPFFAKTFYTMATAGPFPTTPEFQVGVGIEGVTRLGDVGDALAMYDKIDLWVFPDVYFGGYQTMLRKMGARVWGSGWAEKYELDRSAFKELAESLDLDLGRYKYVKGVSEVGAFIKRNPGWFIKTSKHGPPARGDFETLRAEDYDLVQFRLNEIATRLGSRAETTEFILEKPIEDAIELATDCYTVRGQWPTKGILGLEAKAESYLGEVVDYEQFPQSLREVNEAMSPLYKRSKYANMAAIECRLTKDGTAYALDPCLRHGRPPLSIMSMITNWPEIWWKGAEGELVDAEFADKWAAEQMIYCDYAEEHPAPVKIEDKYLPNLRLSNYCIERGLHIVVPSAARLSGLGSIVATGATKEAAIRECREAAKSLRGFDVKVADAFDKAVKQIGEASKFGVRF